jgi:hypothetical protein
MLGNYTPKVCYKTLFEGQEVADTIWWCKSLWKFKCPLKTQIFTWMELNNEVLTWDIRQKRSWRGPNKYPLCKEIEETIYHLLMSCSYTLQVWNKV